MRIILTFCAAAVGFVPAAAQMRPGMPPVASDRQRPGLPSVNPQRIEADPDEGLRQTIFQFGSWNRSMGSPRILLFWNRELSDDTTTRYRTRDRGVSAVAARPGLVIGAHDRTNEQERTTGGKYNDLHPDTSGEFETGFLSAFTRAGANIVDRKALMRKVSTAQGQGDRSDQQFMESLALEQGVQYLVEVLPDYRDSETGFLFTVKITHLPTSSVKAQFRTAALPAPGPERLVAMPGGFERHRDSRNTPDRVAEQLAAETMRGFF